MNIYVGNLPYEVSEEELQKLFESFGTVSSVSIIKDKISGRSRGFGFVEMSSDDEGQKAIDELNGKDFNGKNLTVNAARPKREFKRDDRSNNRGFGNKRY